MREATTLPAGRPAAAALAGRVATASVIAVVVAGVVAQIVRPVAPDPRPLLDPGTLFSTDHLARVAAYRAPLRIAALLGLVLQVAVPFAFVATARGRAVLDAIAARAGWRPLLAAAAAAGVVMATTSVIALPVAFWAGFVHEGAWGFRTSTLGGWLRDWLVARAPGWAAGSIGAAAAAMLVRQLPRSWPAVAALAGALLAGALVFVAPVVLEPLHHRMTPLPDGPVRAEVKRVLAASDPGAGRPPDRILVADASRRTTKMNAYVSGLGATRRIVLYDTLVAGASADEVGLVLAHELGHERNGDLWRNALGSMAGTAVVVYAVAWLWRGRTGIGPREVAAALALIALLSTVSLPLQTWLSRRAEAAADVAALAFTSDPATAMRMQHALAAANLTDPAPPGWATALWGTHPSPAQRLTAAQRWAEQAGASP